MNTTRNILIPAQLEINQDWAYAQAQRNQSKWGMKSFAPRVGGSEKLEEKAAAIKPVSRAWYRTLRDKFLFPFQRGKAKICMKRTKNILKKNASFSLGEEQ